MQFKAARIPIKFGSSWKSSTHGTPHSHNQTINYAKQVRSYVEIPPHKWKVQQIPNPRKQGLWISDNSNIFKPGVFNTLNTQIDNLHRDLTAEIAVVSIPDFETKTTQNPSSKNFATELFNYWGIGNPDTNNGVLLLLISDLKRLEIEIGLGLEDLLPFWWLQQQFENPQMKNLLQKGNYDEVLLELVTRIETQLRTYPQKTRQGRQKTTPTAWKKVQDSFKNPASLPLHYFVFLLAALFFLMAFFQTQTSPTVPESKDNALCPNCKRRIMKVVPSPMTVSIHDAIANGMVTDNQVKEQELGSATYTAYYCSNCQTKAVTRTVSPQQTFACPHCDNNSMHKKERIINQPEKQNPGLAELTFHCNSCSHEEQFNVELPSLEEQRIQSKIASAENMEDRREPFPVTQPYSSSSSSDSGSGFSGGKSSGSGGASVSW